MPSSDEKNAAILQALREAFTPAVERLTPEIEPATVFNCSPDAGEDDE